ncbi:calpain-1 catalytic subunit-like isoform X2 [Ambystoma mexicanum]|uniref:calpain-1 catalytic subunit-like isoform X2 n=1 Tax=Ambystoma mexicanum TaxID=8296 RepID=UPI0037E87E21
MESPARKRARSMDGLCPMAEQAPLNADDQKSQALFVDATFPVDSVLQGDGGNVVWKRPPEMCDDPQFIIDGVTRMDICQGSLSNCWFVSAVASLALHPEFMEQVVPPNQSFREGYNGCFHFKFWQYGTWIEVAVDDLLPTVRIEAMDQCGNITVTYELLFLRSNDNKEFWSSLLEKAYAKLKGGYGALQLGYPSEAMEDMTGGVADGCQLNVLPSELWSSLSRLLEKGALVCCSNIVVTTEDGPVQLLRIRNPWGHTEWTGPWSDGATEWHKLDVNEKRTMNVVSMEDGEFWMSVEDFQKNFQMMDVCHLNPQSLPGAGAILKPWQCAMYEGRWVRGMSSGGSIEQKDQYWLNPQFTLDLLEQDDDPEEPSLACSFIIALTQKHQRLRKAANMRIGLHVFTSDKEKAFLDAIDLHAAAPLLCTDGYRNRQEVVIYSRLPPGHYIIIASSDQSYNEGEFLLRVFTEKGNSASPVDRSSMHAKIPADPSFVPTSLPSMDCGRNVFLQFADADEMMNAFELNQLLKELTKELGPLQSSEGFDLESCRSLVSLMDSCGFGKLGWEDFQTLWSKFCSGTLIFCQFHQNGSGSIDCHQLVPALQMAGLYVDEFLVQLVGLRYCQPDRTVSYSSFICCLLKLDTMSRIFHESACVGSGTVTLNYKQWLRMTMYN